MAETAAATAQAPPAAQRERNAPTANSAAGTASPRPISPIQNSGAKEPDTITPTAVADAGSPDSNGGAIWKNTQNASANSDAASTRFRPTSALPSGRAPRSRASSRYATIRNAAAVTTAMT